MKTRFLQKTRRFISLISILLASLAALIFVVASGARSSSKEAISIADKEGTQYVTKSAVRLSAPSGLITADSTANTVANDGQCTLREAIINANDDAATWVDCEAGSGTDTIVLTTAGTYTLTVLDNGSNGLPQISSAIVIQGNGSTIQRSSGATRFRIFEVAPAGDLTLDHVSVTGGLTADGANGVAGVNNGNGTHGGDGGAIYNTGALTLINSTVTGNATGNGGHGISALFGTAGGNGGFGGAIYNTGTLTLTNSTVIGNKVGDGGFGGGSSFSNPNFFGTVGGRGGRGGGIYHGGGILNINGSTISNNIAGSGGGGGAAGNGSVGGPGGDGGFGGGIHINAGTVTLANTKLNDNRAGKSGDGGSAGYAGGSGFGGAGGAISQEGGTLSITNSTLDNNKAGDAGDSSFGVVDTPGGVGGPGGAIYTRATLNLISSTVSNNSAGRGGRGSIGQFVGGFGRGGKGGGGGDGGGIYNDKDGTINLVNSTISNNSAGMGGSGGDATGNCSPCVGGEGGLGGSGGGINNAGTMILTNATISHNSNAEGGALGNPHTAGLVGTPGQGGGIHVRSGVGFPSTSLKLRNSIIANNIDVREFRAGVMVVSPDVSGPFISLGHNFIGKNDNSAGFTDGSNGDQVGTIAMPKDPLLGQLADNGGPTKTRNLQSASTALEGGDNCVLDQTCASDNLTFDLTTDQRGLLRPQSTSVDIGAVEGVIGVPNAPDLLNASDSGVSQTDNLTNATSLQFEVTGAGAGATVVLVREGAVVATATADTNGIAALSYSDNSADGTYLFTSRLSIMGALGGESASLPVTIDRTRTNVTINQAGGQADPTASLPINFTVVFNDPVSDFNGGDVSLTGSTANVSTATINVTGGGTTYNVAIGNVTTEGTVQASVLENATFDPAGNGSTVSTSGDNTVTRDITAPTVTIDQAAGQIDPTSNLPISFTVVFSEPVTGFADTDVLLTNSTANISVATIAVTGGGTTYNVAIGNIIGSGTVQVSIPAGAANDAAGIASTGSTSTDRIVTYNLPPPSVTINQAVGQLDPTASLPINFIVVFDKPVTGFTNTDVSLTGSTADVSAATINVTGSGSTYNVAVGNVTSDGTVRASIPANVAVNVENAPNSASTSTDNIVTRDTTPTNLTVNTLGDAGDNVCDATCTLRDAIITAANPPGPKHITFNLPACTAASPCTITLTRGELSIPSTSPISIFGPGANVLTINGNNQSRLFVVNNAGLDLNDLKLTGGRASDGSPGGDGGAIYNNNGTLTLTNIILSGNNAGNGGKGNDRFGGGPTPADPGGHGGNGGAIYTTGTLTLINSTVSGNNAGAGGTGGQHYCCPNGSSGSGGDGGSGGAIYNTGTLTLINSTIRNNNAGLGGSAEFTSDYNSNGAAGGAGGNGGGVYSSGPIRVIGSTFNNNNAGAGGLGGNNFGPAGAGGQGGHGGAVYSNGGALVVTNATLSSNNTGPGGKGGDALGGGSIPGGVGGNGGSGGAIYNSTGSLTATNITVTGNTTRGGGIGGCGNAGCAPNGSTGIGGGLANASGTVGTRNSIIAGNNPAGNGPDVSGAITSLGHNFIGKNDGSTGFTNGVNSDQVGSSASPKDPLLGTLQENGGLTQTMIPASNSTAIDAGNNCVGQASHCGDPNITQLTTDQRGTGFARIVNSKGTATVDIGAVEFSDIQQAQINFSNLIQTYDGTPKTITATTVPPGLTLVITYDGATNPPTNVKQDAGGNVVGYGVVATIQDSSYQGTAGATLTITKASQTITFDALSDKTFGDAPFTVSATASSALPVSFSVVSGPASINGATVTLTGAGSVKVRASHAGNGNYNAASDIDRTFTVAKASQTINFGSLAGKIFGDAPFVVSATGGASGRPVIFSSQTPAVCSVNGSTVTILTGGICTIRASQIGNDDYEAAQNVDQSFLVGKASQAISFGALSNKNFGDANFTVSAIATSNLAVSFSANGQCTVTGNTVHLTGAGSCTITASQAGNSNYDAAEDVQQNFGIDKRDQTITFDPLPGKIFGDTDFSIAAIASSGLAVSFSSSGSCSINGSNVHLTGAGSCTITASQSGDDNFEAAPEIQRSFNIDGADQTINFIALSDKTFGDAPFTVSATASSGLPVSFSIQSGPAIITGNTVTITGAGAVTVRASQVGDSNHNAAPHVGRSFTVNKADQAITFNTLSSKTFGDAPFTVTATGGASGNPVTFSTSGNCTAGGTNGSTITITGAGACTVTASQAGNTNYKAATDVSRSFTINRANQTILFGALSNKTLADAPFMVSAAASSSLQVSFTAAGSCTVSGNTVTITAVGICTVTASQSGNSNYNSALPVSSSFNVLGTQGLTADVSSGVQALRQSITDKQDGQRLDDVIKHLTKALDPTLWIDQTHLVPKRGDAVFNQIRDAMEKLCQLMRDKKSTISDADIQLFVDRLILAERLVAQTAIIEASALPHVDTKKLAEATKELLKGDSAVRDRKYSPASDHYREAWKRALEAMRIT